MFAVGLHMITVPLWFVGVYLAIVLAAPAMMRLHQRHVRWPVLGALAAAVAVVDALRLVTGTPLVGSVNYPFVLAGIHRLVRRYDVLQPQRLAPHDHYPGRAPTR